MDAPDPEPEAEPTPPSPYWERLSAHCAAKPGAWEDHPWGETVYKVGAKVFAFLGLPGRSAVTVKAHKDDLDGLLALPFIQRSAYIGRYGWVTVSIEDDAALDLALELIDTSYTQVAPKGKRKAAAPPG